MQSITPFLWFDNSAEEAVHFYVSVFSGSPNPKGESKVVSIKRYPDKGLEGPMQGFEGKVLTAVFTLAGQTFMGLDGGPYFKPTPATSFYVECETQEEVDYFWEKLSSVQEAEQCGWLKDKFGFSWQIIPSVLHKLMSDPDAEKAKRVTHAMLQMKKFNIAELERAAEDKS